MKKKECAKNLTFDTPSWGSEQVVIGDVLINPLGN